MIQKIVLIGVFTINIAFANEYQKLWKNTYQIIKKECLLKNYQAVSCKFGIQDDFSHGNVLISALREFHRLTATAERISVSGMWGAISYFINPNIESYWDYYQVGQDYDGIKSLMYAKAQREDISSCQAACLATCVSSKLIRYSTAMLKLHYQTARDAIERREGDCKSFSAIAEDLMTDLGLYAKTVWGFTSGGGHAMVKVFLDNKWHIMEPQNSYCEFINY